MRLCLTIAVLLWALVFKTVSSQTLGTISGPSQGSLSISTLPEDCPSTVDVFDIVFISAVPIAIGFGLLLLFAFLQDVRQARKSKRSRPPTPHNIQGDRARKERSYVIHVDYAYRSHWSSFLRRCAFHKSPFANKSPRLMRLQGTFGFSKWLSFDLVFRKTSEEKTVTTPRSIGKLVAVEMKYPSASSEFNYGMLPSSNIGACRRGTTCRACKIEIKKIHALDTKTQDLYTSGLVASSSGMSSSDSRVTTIIPLVLSTAPPVCTFNDITYHFKNGSLWISAFIPWHKGNFTESRHITCLFACVSYSMVAVQVMSQLSFYQSTEDSIIVNLTDVTITTAMLNRAIVAGVVVFALLGIVEKIFRGAPTIWSMHLPSLFPRSRNTGQHIDSLERTPVHSAPGDFHICSFESVEKGLPRLSIGAPALQQKECGPSENTDQQVQACSSCFNTSGKQCDAASDTYQTTNIADNIKYNQYNARYVGLTRYFQWTMINGHGIYKQKIENMSTIKTCTKLNADTSNDYSVNGIVQVEKHSSDENWSAKIDTKALPSSSSHLASTTSDDICGDNQSICSTDLLECNNELTSHKYPLCHQTTGGIYYNPGFGCLGEKTSVGYNLCNRGMLSLPEYAYSSSGLDSAGSCSHSLSSSSPRADLSRSSSCDSCESASISASSIVSSQLPDGRAPHNTQGVIRLEEPGNDNIDKMDRYQTAPSLPPSRETSQHQPDFISSASSTSGLLYKENKTTCEQETDGQCQGSKHLDDKRKQEDTNAQATFLKYSDALLEPEIKTAQVLRTKNYISRFSAMGKGRVVILPLRETKSWDELLPKDKFTATQPTEDNLPTDETKSEAEVGPIIQTPQSVTFGFDYIINLPVQFEMPTVTIQKSNSYKPFFFNFRKWLKGLRSSPKAGVGDDYKLEVTEDDVALKTSDVNSCFSYGSDIKGASDSIQMEENAKGDTNAKGCSLKNIVTALPNASKGESIDSEMTDDQLKGPIFQSSGRLIKYQRDAVSVASLGSWSSTTSHNAANRHPAPCLDVNTVNENNNSNETAVVIMDPSSSTMPQSTTSADYVSPSSYLYKTSSSSSSIIPKSSSSEEFSHSSEETCSTIGISGKRDISAGKQTRYKRKKITSRRSFTRDRDTYSWCSTCGENTTTSCSGNENTAARKENVRWKRYKVNKATCGVEPAFTPAPARVHCRVSRPVVFLALHILLIASCVLALLWSLSSCHGLCWNAFWEWVATSIIAILIHGVILDTFKAATMTIIKLFFFHNVDQRPYSVTQ